MNFYCELCGNTLSDIMGNPCECTNKPISYSPILNHCDFIPKIYKGIKFNKDLVKSSMPEIYGNFLDKTRNLLIRGKFHKNLLLCSPINTSKTIWVYDIIGTLFSLNQEVAPYFDLLEIKRILLDIYSKDFDYIYTVPILFVKIPLEVNKYIFNSIETLIDRRIKKDVFTILTYQGNYKALSGVDEFNLLSDLRGDGSFKSILIEQYYKNI